MNHSEFTTIIVITPKDFPRIAGHYKRLVNNIPARDFVFVSGDGISDELEKANLGDNVSYLHENELLTFKEVNDCMAEHLKDILQGDPVPRAATGWYYQQFLKMQYAYHCNDEYYMTWDGDTIPCKPFSMFQEGTNAPYLDMKQEYHALYFETLEKILPGMKKCLAKSFISEHMLFNTNIMKQLIDKIEANDSLPGKTYWEKIIHAIAPERICDSGFSEFETYGTFVAYTDPGLYKLREWHSFRLGAEFFDPETISDRDYEWLSKDFFAISFEKNQFVRSDNKNLFDNPEYQSKLSARKMLEIAQEEFNGGYIEVWGDNNGQLAMDPLATGSDTPAATTENNGYAYSNISSIPEDVIYDRLGDSKISSNINQAYLCYENAEYLCKDAERKKIYTSKKQALLDSGKVTVKKTAISIVSYNCKKYMEDCIRSIRFTCAPDTYEIVVTDNASTDGVRDYLMSISDNITLVLSDTNLGFPGGCNACIENASEDYDIFLLNNDTRLAHNSLFWLRYGLYEDDNVGAAGCIGNFAGNDQDVKLNLQKPEDFVEYGRRNNIPMANPYEEKSRLCGFAMLIKREVLNKVGLFDEAFAPGYFEDDDLSMRISEAGYRMLVVHNSFIYHKGSESTNEKMRSDTAGQNSYTAMQDVVKRNFFYIQEKYGYNNFAAAIIVDNEKTATANITHSSKDYFKYLEINAGSGNYLSYLKHLYPNSHFIGTCDNEEVIKRGVKEIPILHLDAVNDKLPFVNKSFDYILVKVPAEKKDILTPKLAKEKCAPLVKDGGQLLYIISE